MNARRFLPTALLCFLTALSISGCGSDKPSSPETEDASLPPVETDSGVPGEEDASVTDPDAGPGDECEAPSCSDDGIQYCKEGRWTPCTGTDVCREGSCIPKPVCEPGVCSEDSASICSPMGQWTPCGGVCENGTCSECAENTCSEDGSKECLLGHWSECSPSTVCLYEACAAPDCSPNTCSADENYRCQNGRWARCELGTACAEGTCRPKEGFATLGYVACTKNSDCSFGICLKELTLSRIVPATGRSKITIHELDSRIAEGEGVCSMDCTASSSICERIGSSQPYTCQLAWSGVSPYPADAELPIETLDLEEMARSIPFAALCRPALQKLEAFGESFCASCDSDESCGDGFVCAMEQMRPTPSGSCVRACTASAECPLGFQCGALNDGSTGTWCLPIQGTCGSCLDRDHDLMGLGQCLLSGVDCDDSDEDASFSTGKPPICEPGRDRNCNGKDDRPELLGTTYHCTECGAVCNGAAEGFANASKQCLGDPEAENGFICATACASGYGDCNGDLQSPESNGCEIELFKDGMLYGLDDDGDGYPAWDPQREETRFSLKYCCSESGPCWAETKNANSSDSNQIVWGRAREDDKTWRKIAENYSSQNADCDDKRADTHPGADETCNGLDDNCDGVVDNSVVSVLSIDGHDYREGEACPSGLSGVCGTGAATCGLSDGTTKMYCHSDSNGTQEVCNAQDDDWKEKILQRAKAVQEKERRIREQAPSF